MTKSLYSIEYDFSFAVEIHRTEVEIEKRLEEVSGYKDKDGNPIIVYQERMYGHDAKVKIFIGEKEIYLSELQEKWNKFVHAERCGQFMVIQPRVNDKPILKYIETIYREDWASDRFFQLKRFLKEELDIEIVLYKEN